MGEVELVRILCTLMLGGEAEAPQPYDVGYNLHRVYVDCETETHVYEVGLDKRSSFDSLHQALFAAELTEKTPGIIVIDTDGFVDQYETQLRAVASRAGVTYITFDKAEIVRIPFTNYLQNYAASQPAEEDLTMLLLD